MFNENKDFLLHVILQYKYKILLFSNCTLAVYLNFLEIEETSLELCVYAQAYTPSYGNNYQLNIG